MHWHWSPYPFMAAFATCFFLPWAFMFQFNYDQGLLAILSLALAVVLGLVGGVGWVGETVGVIDDEGWSPSAMMMFIGTEIMTIAGVLAAYWTIRLEAPIWPPAGTPELEAPLGWTIFLLLSSFTIAFARKKGEAGDAKGFGNLVLVSMLIWVVFASSIIMTWGELGGQGFTVGVNAYATALYGFSGIHFAHLLFGLLIMLLILKPSFAGKYSPSYARATTMYVHFVNIIGVWAILQIYYWH
ncbi:MAG: cytochrome c oxidase subunit 3 [Mariprofundales bacterium]